MTSLIEPTVPVPTVTDSPRTGEQDSRANWAGFAVVLAALVLNILDSTIVNVAAPTVQRDLGMTSSALEWVAASYTLALAVGLMTGARLGDRYGRRRMLLLGAGGFLVASVLCSLAWSGETLVAARTLQGLAAAIMVPQSFGLIRDLFSPRQIGRAFAALGPAIGLSTVLGPVVAGLLMEADPAGTGWRSLFLINVPVCLFVLAYGARTLPVGLTPHNGVRLDLVGAALLGLASLLVVFPLVDGRAQGWPTWMLAVLAASVPVLALFVVHQRSRSRRGRPTLFALSLLAKRSYVSGVLFTLVFFGSVVGFSLTTGLFLQIGLGFSAMHASLYLAALAVGAFGGAGVGAWAATAVGRPILHVGLSVMAAGTLLLWWSLVHGDARPGAVDLVPGLFAFGLGMGMIFVPLFSIIMGEIDDDEVGSASGLLESLQQLGASLGVAALGTLFFDRLALEDGGPQAAVAAGRHLAAAEDTLLALVGVIALAWAVGWLLPRRPRSDY